MMLVSVLSFVSVRSSTTYLSWVEEFDYDSYLNVGSSWSNPWLVDFAQSLYRWSDAGASHQHSFVIRNSFNHAWNFTLDISLRFPSGASDLSASTAVLFRYASTSNYYELTFYPVSGNITLHGYASGTRQTYAQRVYALSVNVWYPFTVKVFGSTFSLISGGSEIMGLTLPPLPAAGDGIGLCANKAAVEHDRFILSIPNPIVLYTTTTTTTKTSTSTSVTSTTTTATSTSTAYQTTTASTYLANTTIYTQTVGAVTTTTIPTIIYVPTGTTTVLHVVPNTVTSTSTSFATTSATTTATSTYTEAIWTTTWTAGYVYQTSWYYQTQLLSMLITDTSMVYETTRTTEYYTSMTATGMAYVTATSTKTAVVPLIQYYSLTSTFTKTSQYVPDLQSMIQGAPSFAGYWTYLGLCVLGGLSIKALIPQLTDSFNVAKAKVQYRGKRNGKKALDQLRQKQQLKTAARKRASSGKRLTAVKYDFMRMGLIGFLGAVVGVWAYSQYPQYRFDGYLIPLAILAPVAAYLFYVKRKGQDTGVKHKRKTAAVSEVPEETENSAIDSGSEDLPLTEDAGKLVEGIRNGNQ